ncbi:FUSC family protein [Rathayibacter soli]|uniref:FUSC family protein n=1 Tax=Rathayibacter soli TaxID=3144168 RepID=UPI0027E45630|nr:aromatic acid exporter family protein [Glaciibacter superstes]
MKFAQALRAASRVPFLQTAKAAVATVAAWLIASALLPEQVPVFAAIAALLVVQPSVNQSFGKAVERTIGVIVGVLVAYVVIVVFGRSSWAVLLAIVVAIFIAWALRLTVGTANQVPISAMLVLSIGATNPDYAFNRIIETMIGAAIAIIVNLVIVAPILLAPAQDAVRALTEELAATLERLAGALVAPQTTAELAEMLLTARLLRPMQVRAQTTLTQAEESLTFNPRGSKHKRTLGGEQELFARMPALVTRALGMTRAVHDHYDDSLRSEPTVKAIADELSRAAHDLRLIAAHATEATAAAAQPAAGAPIEPEDLELTAPLIITTPHPQHWVLLGSLLEDLRRIHEEIVGSSG